MSSIRDLAEQAAQLYNAGRGGPRQSLHRGCDGGDAFRHRQGRAAIHELLSGDKAAFPDRTSTLDVIVEQGDIIAEEWTLVATHTGPLVMPDGTELPPTGKRIEHKGMNLVQVCDGMIAMFHMYFDSMAMAGQLGVLPGDATT